MKQHQKQQKIIRLGTHGEDYGSWMSNPVFYMIGGLLTLSAVLAALSFSMFHIAALGILFSVAAAALLALLIWCAWIRKQYAFGGGGMMERVHQVVLSHLDFDGQGQLLEVGCGSGALSIRAALTWPDAQITGMDYWGVAYGYGQAMCEKNAESEGVGFRCAFRHGDANKLDFPDESFDAVVSNYVYHNVMGADKQALLLETLRVLKKGGVFALNDDMKPKMYGDMDAFVQKLRDMGYGTGLYPTGDYCAVKVPVFSFEKLHDVDIQLGPEMKSTGEVLGIAPNMHEALIKGLVAAGYQFKTPGPGSCVIISVKDSDKKEAAELAWKLHDYGYKIYGTPGTARYLNSQMVPCSTVRQMSEERPNVLDLLESGLVDYIISTSPHGRDPHRDSVKFRRKATELSIPCITALDTARILVNALRSDHDISGMELVDIATLHRDAANGK